MSSEPVRLGLYLSRLPGFDKRGFDRRELIECARVADACGYDSIWVPEAWERDAFSLLTDLAVQTSRIGLGTGIVNVFSRSPALLAMSAATVDEISGGRVRLGLGTSGPRVIRNFHGLPFSKPLTRLRETVAIIRALLRGEQVSFEGDCFRLEGFKLGFEPLRESIPIYIAALGPRGLTQLGEIADGWLPVYWPPSELDKGISLIREGAVAAGRDVAQIEIAPFINVVVDDDLDRAREAARLPLAYYVGGMGGHYHASLRRLGFGDCADEMRRLWRGGKRKSAIRAVPDDLIDAVSICGEQSEVRRRLRWVVESGADLPIIPIPSRGTLSEKCRLIEALSPAGFES